MNNETLADILAEFRKFAMRAAEEDKLISPESVLLLADKAEAAAKREKVEAVTVAATKAVNLTDEKWRRDTGNATALRAALEEQLRYWDTHVRTRDEEDMRVRTEAALSAPPRNCDVGTAEEQGIRCLATMRYWRKTYEGDALITAIMKWAQMTYKEGGAE